ncbi:MAG: hypothetical protein WDK96_00290 [Candidatus Paceibacterota bacterium]|jgi:ribosomal protein S21
MKNINIEVKKNQNENNASLIRRFSKRVQESQVLQKARSKRYNERAESKLTLKKGALKRLAKRKVNEKLRKMGKIA